MKWLLLFSSITLFTGFSIGQGWYEKDTMRYQDRTGGSLDSMDVSGAIIPSTVDGIYFSIDPISLSGAQFIEDITTAKFFRSFDPYRMKFSALPRIGFSYSLGSQGTQLLNTNYTQVFNKHLMIDLNYERLASNGYLRNSGFEYHKIQFGFSGEWKRYAFDLRANYLLDKRNFSGGLVTDTLVDEFVLDILPVNKQACNSRYSRGAVDFSQYLNIGDSVSKYGITTSHGLDVSNRKFYEEDTLYGIYNSYIDSFSTYDQFNFPTVTNAAGLFFMNNKLYADLKYGVSYWEFQNGPLQTDTLENNITSTIQYQSRRVNISSEFYYNVSGNYNGLSEALNFSYRFGKQQFLIAKASFQDLPPMQYQRFYRSNNFNYTIDNVERQSISRLTLGYENRSLLDSLLTIGFTYQYLEVNNPYIWDDSIWTQQIVSNISVSTVQLNVGLRWKYFHFNQMIRYTSDNDSYLPDFIYTGRLYMKKPVLKSGKMKLLYGAEFLYVSSFKQRRFIPAMEVFEWKTNTMLPAYTTAAVYGGFEIDEFRFYARLEQLGYWWNDQKRADVENYTLPGVRLRVGIVWDFFN
ncbi:MAG: hypothetical protein EP322_03170 [Bacteroidetes bacterium]|nr:MAG: hypothetical protein EP322_03170 [Bacteroidota bacterium]